MPKVKAQIHMDDNIIKNDELEELLEKRETLKQGVTDYRQTDKEAKTKIQTIKTPMPYRVGRFLIAKQTISAKTVSFETEEGSRITIKNMDED